ncbi:hypothetical protein [Shewanella colwelliana]|uniref:Uncharacterized protein n=1 Tax=Shewanella colwelliana TaxID=23 RepID=A0ABQ4NYQ2_SHECO|nr:hypothetical protein [Shewanella colwelliana]MCZ4339422.1 hypothetical protein [Shewanella colwelliana]MDX1282711.1 hypothetical protein [Shewanella colwelliana]GIU24035.1 hypothetical protein TUM4644_18180 [Shewanella colwelliana]GIU40105.1 hypothetical protein TUM3794_17230 [Shewanella colwelliana]
MSKEHRQGREGKKQPLKTAKEKRNEKHAKKVTKGLLDNIK